MERQNRNHRALAAASMRVSAAFESGTWFGRLVLYRSAGIVQIRVFTDFFAAHVGDFITPLRSKQQRLHQGAERAGLAEAAK